MHRRAAADLNRCAGGARDGLHDRNFARIVARQAFSWLCLSRYGALEACTTAGGSLEPMHPPGIFSVTGLHMPTPSPTAADEDPPEARDVTRKLAHYVVATRFEDLPEGVRREVGTLAAELDGGCCRCFTARGVEIALAAVTPFSGPPQAGVFGRSEASRRSQRCLDQRHQLACVRLR